MMAAKLWLALAALYGFSAVALGAFGAHGLRHRLGADLMSIYQTAVQYHFWHALALLGAVALLPQRPVPWLHAAAACWALGTLLFSGSLYALALSGVRGLGAITPFGGVLLLAGWACLLVGALRAP